MIEERDSRNEPQNNGFEGIEEREEVDRPSCDRHKADSSIKTGRIRVGKERKVTLHIREIRKAGLNDELPLRWDKITKTGEKTTNEKEDKGKNVEKNIEDHSIKTMATIPAMDDRPAPRMNRLVYISQIVAPTVSFPKVGEAIVILVVVAVEP